MPVPVPSMVGRVMTTPVIEPRTIPNEPTTGGAGGCQRWTVQSVTARPAAELVPCAEIAVL